MMIVGKPWITSPNKIVFIKTKIIYINAESDESIPNIVDNLNGVVVYDVIPSMAKLSNLMKLNDDLPCCLSL